MTINYRTLLKSIVIESEADDLLATRIPDLCPDCMVSGECEQYPCSHRNAPTFADLLRWGENLLVATEGRGGLIHLRSQPLHYSDDYELLAALRTEADHG